jgi:hypothetical protein
VPNLSPRGVLNLGPRRCLIQALWGYSNLGPRGGLIQVLGVPVCPGTPAPQDHDSTKPNQR